jgi:hypothetical protein
MNFSKGIIFSCFAHHRAWGESHKHHNDKKNRKRLTLKTGSKGGVAAKSSRLLLIPGKSYLVFPDDIELLIEFSGDIRVSQQKNSRKYSVGIEFA